MKRTTILLADDHEVVIQGLRRMLDRPEFEIAGAVHDGIALVEAAHAMDPDVIIVDVTMPMRNGIEATRQLHQSKCRAKIIYLTMHPDVSLATEAMAAGGSAYVLKNGTEEELILAIHDALCGRIYIAPPIREAVRLSLARLASSRGAEPDVLTPRKREILQLLAEGRQVKEIAALLNISPRTVEFHKYGIMTALGVHSVADLARYAARHRIVP